MRRREAPLSDRLFCQEVGFGARAGTPARQPVWSQRYRLYWRYRSFWLDLGFEVGDYIKEPLIETAVAGDGFLDGDVGDVGAAEDGDAAPLPVVGHFDGGGGGVRGGRPGRTG